MLTEEMQEEVVKYLPLAKSMAGKFRTLDFEEAFASASLALVEAAEKYDVEKQQFGFGPFAKVVVLNKLKGMYNEQIKKFPSIDVQQLETSRDQPGQGTWTSSIYSENGPPVKIDTSSLTALDLIEKFEVMFVFKSFYQRCTQEEQLLIRLVAAGATQSECAEYFKEHFPQLKMSQPTIYRIISRLVKTLKKELEIE